MRAILHTGFVFYLPPLYTTKTIIKRRQLFSNILYPNTGNTHINRVHKQISFYFLLPPTSAVLELHKQYYYFKKHSLLK